jgi:hypothetical protein
MIAPALAGWLLLLQAPAVSPSAAAALPDGNAYVRGLVARQKRREALLNDYTYDVERVKEELDGNGRVKERHARHYEVFFVKGKPVRRLVAENGRPLSSHEQEEEDRRNRDKIDAINTGKVASEVPEERISAILQRYDFRAVGREEIEGRPALVFDFKPLPGKRDDLDSDNVLRTLNGRLWVDEAEQEVVRMHVRNASSIKWGFGLGASVSALESTVEFRKVDDAVWLPVRDEMTASGRLLLLKRFRTRMSRTYGNYRRFQVEAQEHSN